MELRSNGTHAHPKSRVNICLKPWTVNEQNLFLYVIEATILENQNHGFPLAQLSTILLIIITLMLVIIYVCLFYYFFT